MSIKNLFGDSGKILSNESLDSVASGEVESGEFIRQSLLNQEKFVPPVNYSVPALFAKFGSAEKYYQGAISLPLYYNLSIKNLMKVIKSVKDIVKKYEK